MRLNVNSDMLIWARERSGISIEALATKMKKEPEVIEQWENGTLELGRPPALSQVIQ